MSIGTSPFQGGGGASVADATETTAGKIRIATSTEASTGTNDTTAMTPLTVKERIDAALVGGVEYKGTFNANTGLTNSGDNLNNAEKGDLYIIDTLGTIYGQTWAVGDHLLINDNMGGSIDNSKIDKVDNTDAVTSVNGLSGPVVLNGGNVDADYSASNYTAANANIDGHLEGIDDQFALTAPLASPALTGTPTAPTATSGTNTTQIATTAYVTAAVATGGGAYQPIDAGLTSISGLTTAADKMIYTTGSDTYATTTLTSFARTLLDDPDATTVRSSLFLGTAATSASTDFQPVDAGLTSISGLTTAANKMIYTTSSDTYAVADLTSAGRALLDDADAAAQRTTLGLGTAATSASTDFQPVDAGLTSISGLTTAADKMIYTTGSDTYAVADLTSAGRALLDDADAAAQRTTLGLGTAATSASGDFQPVDAGLTSISGLTTAADKMIYTTGSDTYAVTGLTAAGRALLDDADAAAQRTTLGLGTAATSASGDFQPVDAGLTSISGLTTAADKMIYTTGSDTYAVTGLTAAGRAILDDADAAAQRTTLGLGTAATSNTGDFLANVSEDSSPQLGGDLDLNGSDIVTTGNADLSLAPAGTGFVEVKGNTNPGALRLNCESNSHGVQLQSPAHSANATYQLILPTGVGTAGQVLKTDGGDGTSEPTAQLSWVDQSGGGGGGVTYSAITADPANAQAGYHYSCTGTFTITLATSGYSAGDEIRVKNMGTGTITIDPQTTTIDGSTTDYTLDVQYSSITLVSTGTNWEII